MSKEQQQQQLLQEKTENREDTKTSLGFLPPQSLPKPSPPPPIPNQDSSDLLSPWWSEKNEAISFNSSSSSSSSSPSSSPDSTSTSSSSSSLDADSSDRTMNVTLLGFSRKSKTEGDWKETCFMLVTTEKKIQQEEQQKRDKPADDESFAESVKKLAENSEECSMVCFLRQSRRLTKERLASSGQTSIFTQLNPFYGSWISVAKTPMKCKEHLEINHLTKKTEKDYYTFELGDELTHSGDHVKRAFSNTFGPLQRFGTRYIDSWKNGNQQAFFTRFWESAKRGDGINLVTYSTKKLIESAIGHDKKSNNKDK